MVNIVSQAIKIESPYKLKPLKYEIPLDYIEENMLGQTQLKEEY